ncbi:MAG TPA: SPOR domain-containing protein [Rhodocyclaceae bacterium]
MNEPKRDASPEEGQQDDALRRKLVSRIAVAGVMIVALLGGLAVIDALYVPPAVTTPPKMSTLTPPPMEPKSGESKAEDAKPEEPKPAADGANAKPTEVAKAEPETKAEPEKTEAPPVTGRSEEKAEKPLKPLTKPAELKPATMRPSEPVVTKRPEPAKEAARAAPISPLAQHAPASKPLSRSEEAPRRFLVQMGVFNNISNAEDLRAKLEMAGVPTHIEARVQVGPFATREEAEAARQKLVALGMEPGLLVSVKK